MAVALQAAPETMTVEAAARRFGISRTFAYQLAARDKFPVRLIRVGERILVPTAEVDRALGLTQTAPEGNTTK